MALDAVLPHPPSGARPGSTALGAPAAKHDGPSFADLLSTADSSAPPVAPASPSPSAAAPHANARRRSTDDARSDTSKGASPEAGTDAGSEDGARRTDPAAQTTGPDAADGPAHTHVAAHGRAQALAHARARAAAQAVERARAERAGRGETAAGTGSDGPAGLARDKAEANTEPLTEVDAVTAAKDTALHAAAVAADPALAPLQPAGSPRLAEQATAAIAGTADPSASDAATARRTGPASDRLSDTAAALTAGALATPPGLASTEPAAASNASAAAASSQTALAAAVLAAATTQALATDADAKGAAPDAPVELLSGSQPSGAMVSGASGAGVPGGASRHASTRAPGAPAPLTAAGAADGATAVQASLAGQQGDALRALGERLRGGPDTGAEATQTPAPTVVQPPLPAGVASPRSDVVQAAVQEAAAPGGPYPITVPVQDPYFADAFAERVTWLVREGLQSAELTLNPQDLGPIQIELALDGDAASIGVVAADPEARGAIEQALPRLREMLTSQGLQLGGAMIDAGTGRSPQGDGGRGRGPRPEGRGGIVSLLGSAALDPSGATSTARAAHTGRIDVFA
jgi:flagellar hook-length control protein FliK